MLRLAQDFWLKQNEKNLKSKVEGQKYFCEDHRSHFHLRFQNGCLSNECMKTEEKRLNSRHFFTSLKLG